MDLLIKLRQDPNLISKVVLTPQLEMPFPSLPFPCKYKFYVLKKLSRTHSTQIFKTSTVCGFSRR